jgi:hypothetical protein
MIYESLEIVELGHAEDLIEFGPFGDIDESGASRILLPELPSCAEQ